MSIKLRSKKTNTGYSLYLDCYYKGKRQYIFLDLHTSKDYTSSSGKKRIDNTSDREILKLANEILLQHQLDFVRNGYKLVLPEKKMDIWEYLNAKAAEKKHRTYIAAIKKLQSFVPSLCWDLVTPVILNEFQKYLSDCGKSDTTVHHYTNRILIIFRMAVADGLLKHSQITINVLPVDDKNVNEKALTFEEIQQLMSIEAIPTQIKQAFLFGCLTGLRFSDIISLKWNDIKSDVITIKMVKTQKSLIQPLSEQTKILLDEIPKINDYVFQISSNIETINRKLKAWGELAGIEKKVTTHVARHTFATIGYQNGIDIYTMSKLLGHTSVKHTEIYTTVSIDEKRKGLDKMPKLL